METRLHCVFPAGMELTMYPSRPLIYKDLSASISRVPLLKVCAIINTSQNNFNKRIYLSERNSGIKLKAEI